MQLNSGKMGRAKILGIESSGSLGRKGRTEPGEGSKGEVLGKEYRQTTKEIVSSTGYFLEGHVCGKIHKRNFWNLFQKSIQPANPKGGEPTGVKQSERIKARRMGEEVLTTPLPSKERGHFPMTIWLPGNYRQKKYLYEV